MSMNKSLRQSEKFKITGLALLSKIFLKEKFSKHLDSA